MKDKTTMDRGLARRRHAKPAYNTKTMELEEIKRIFDCRLNPGENLRFYVSGDSYCLDIFNVPEIVVELGLQKGATAAVKVYSGVDDFDFGPDDCYTDGGKYPVWREELHDFLGEIVFTSEGSLKNVIFAEE